MATRWWSSTEIAESLSKLVPDSISRVEENACYLVPEKLVEAMMALRDDADSNFVHLTNLCAADYWDKFEVIYHIQSLEKNCIASVKVEVLDRENPVLPSVTSVWHGAWLQECEAYDLYGIRFENHPNLTRILLWEGYPGWPLRKDFLTMPGGLQPGLNEFSGTAAKPEPPVHTVE
ncbi:MAG: NADH-quinone oxidoreductase subunit C [Tepidiformaceae bacterium]